VQGYNDQIRAEQPIWKGRELIGQLLLKNPWLNKFNVQI
jgi:hypothetical protein